MTKAPEAELIPDSDNINIVRYSKGRMVDPKLKYVLESMFSPMKYASDIYSYAKERVQITQSKGYQCFVRY